MITRLLQVIKEQDHKDNTGQKVKGAPKGGSKNNRY